MKQKVLLRAAVGSVFAFALAVPAVADVPEAINITCDVERTPFRNQAKTAPDVTFRLYDQEIGGSQIGGDYVVDMDALVVEKIKPERYDDVKRRPYVRLEAVIGPPVDLDSSATTGELWLDVQVATEILTCDDGKRVKLPSVAPPARRKLESVPFARESQDISARVFNTVDIPIANDVPGGSALTFNSERWDTDDIHDTTTNTGRLTARTAGKYLILANIEWDYSTSGKRWMAIRRTNQNGTKTIALVSQLSVTDLDIETGQSVVTHRACHR